MHREENTKNPTQIKHKIMFELQLNKFYALWDKTLENQTQVETEVKLSDTLVLELTDTPFKYHLVSVFIY